MACRIENAREWKTRALLEADSHKENMCVTLTFAPEHLPEGGSLDPKLFTKWMKRFRFAVDRDLPGTKVRYYQVAEYGGEHQRPHHHVIVFGLRCHYGYQVLKPGGGYECQCDTHKILRETWTFGHVKVQEFTKGTVQYLTEYLINKRSGERAKEFLKGRHPEYCTMSRRPGIGHLFIPKIAEVFKHTERRAPKRRIIDVPSGVRMGKAMQPFGRYYRRKLRVACGRDESCPAETLELARQKTAIVFEGARKILKQHVKSERALVQQIMSEANEQPARNMVARLRNKGRVRHGR
jgi:hypothetical protein